MVEKYSNMIFYAGLNEKLLAKEGLVLSIDESYKIQKKVVELKNKRIKGYKIAMTSKETQSWFNAKEPIFGTLNEDNFLFEDLNLSKMNSPLIEAEIAFIAKEDIDLNKNILELINSFRVAPAFEIPDSRYREWFPNLTLSELIIDNGVAGKVHIGESIEIEDYSNLKKMETTLYFNGEVLGKAFASEVMGDPVNSIEWIVKKLREQNMKLEKGMTILSGSVMNPVKIIKGVYSAEFSGMGSVNIRVITE